MDEEFTEIPSILRYKLEEELNQLEHLERSQQELLEYLASSPDPECQQAFDSNIAFLTQKEQRILRIHAALMNSDVAYRKEKIIRASLSNLLMIHETSERTGTAEIAEMVETTADTEDAGMEPATGDTTLKEGFYL